MYILRTLTKRTPNFCCTALVEEALKRFHSFGGVQRWQRALQSSANHDPPDLQETLEDCALDTVVELAPGPLFVEFAATSSFNL